LSLIERLFLLEVAKADLRSLFYEKMIAMDELSSFEADNREKS